jgi:hypothetical protein
MTAAQLLDRELPEIRSWILQLAAALDRIDRAGPVAKDDPRCQRVRRGIELLLHSDRPDRAEQVQLAFSREYEADWRAKFEIAPSK